MHKGNSEHDKSAINGILSWLRISLIGLMALTGFEIHSATIGFGFKLAITLHTYIFLCFLHFSLFIFSWALINRVWKRGSSGGQAVESNIMARLRAIIAYAYNPIRSRVFIVIESIVLILQITTGILYLNYNLLSEFDLFPRLQTIAYAHTSGGFVISACLVLHVYLSYLATKKDQIKNNKIVLQS